MLEITMVCTENKSGLTKESGFKEIMHICQFGILPTANEPHPYHQGDLTVVGKNPFPYKVGESYKFKMTEDLGLVVTDKMPGKGDN